MNWFWLSTMFVLTHVYLNGMEKDSDTSYRDVMSVIQKYSKSIKSENGILLRGYGLNYAGQDKVYDGKIHVIDLSYSIDANIQYKDARQMFYSMVDGLLDRINKDESLKQYFFHSPVGYQDLWVSLSFDYESKGFLKRDDLDAIHIAENKIYYFIAEKDGVARELKQRRVVPDVYILTDVLSNTRSIVRKLPEGPEALEDPTPEQIIRH